jgi:hypothetical protein
MAINAANVGDTIIVRPGTYNESLLLNKAITLTAESYDSTNPANNNTIIDGGGAAAIIAIPPGVSPMPTLRGFVIRNGDDGIRPNSEFVVEYCYFTEAVDLIDYEVGSGGITRHNLFFAASDDALDLDNQINPLLIEHNRLLYSTQDGIEIRLQDTTAPTQLLDITIRYNEIIGSGEDGIQFIDYTGEPQDTNRRFFIHNNLFANNQMAGIGLMPNEQTDEDYAGADIIEAIRVYHNTFYGHDYGISGGDNLVAFNNIIANSTTLAVSRVQGSPGDNSVVAETLFFSNGSDHTESVLGPGNLFDQDPLFIALPSPGVDGQFGTLDDDFSGLVLQAGSPAIDAGITQFTAVTGELIPPAPITTYNGLAPDLGWKEYDPANSALVAVNDNYLTLPGMAISVAAPGVLANDTGNGLTAVLNSDVTTGTLTLQANGAFVYTPTNSFLGPDSFTYHATDGLADSNLATVTITIVATLPEVKLYLPLMIQ